VTSLRVVARSPVRRLAPAAAYAALAVATASIARSRPELALAGDSRAALAAELAVGAALVATALVIRRAEHAWFPALLAAAALAWLLSEWASPGAASALAAGLALGAAWPVLLAAAALRGPDERRLGPLSCAVLVLGALACVGVLGVAATLVFDPALEGCADCPRNLLLAGGDHAAWTAISQAGLAAAVAWSFAFAAFSLGRLARASAARRRVEAPVLLPAAAAIALFGVDCLHGFDRGFTSNDAVDRALRLGEAAALVLVAAGAAWTRVQARRTRAELARVVVDLGAAPSPGDLRDRLAAALGDDSLELLHALDDESGWVDANGRRAEPEPADGRELTPVIAGGRTISAIRHRAGLLDDPAVARAIGVTARLAVEHARLGAVRRARLEQLRASRARIVEAADRERRRLERDLHDGAQQRLVTLAVGMRLARRQASGDPELEAGLADAERELRDATVRLRGLAHGLFPAALGEEGLAAAIAVLAEGEPRLVSGELPADRFAPSVESAAYFMVSEALRLTSDGDVTVAAAREQAALAIDIITDAPLREPPLRAEDRIAALGGTLTAGTRALHAELPCES
jgi:signal transduction histidine kinase